MAPKHEFCEMDGCEAPAAVEVEVSEKTPGDSSRSLCYPCSEAYCIGAQHCRITQEHEQPTIGHLCEAVADIAYLAGARRYHSGDSRADVQLFIEAAKKFEAEHRRTDWDNGPDYMLAIEECAQKLFEQNPG